MQQQAERWVKGAAIAPRQKSSIAAVMSLMMFCISAYGGWNSVPHSRVNE